MDESPVFYQFPEEILTAIVEDVIKSCKWEGEPVSPTMKAIRLSNPKFAYLRQILEALFAKVRFIATSEHVDHLERADISRIALFVRHVVFLPPPESWALTLEDFKKIAHTQAVDNSERNPERWNSYVESIHQHDSLPQSIGRQWKDMFSVSDVQIRTEFDDYHARALKRKDFISGTTLKLRWIQALGKLEHVHSIQFSSIADSTPKYGDFSVRPGYSVDPHLLKLLNWQLYEHTAAPVGDALFELGINCLAAANRVVRELGIRHSTTGGFQWDRFSTWNNLDLNQLHRLVFAPNVFAETGEPGCEHEIELNATRALSAILGKCKNSLKRLKCEAKLNDCSMTWPTDENHVISLPKLKVLALCDGAISPDKFEAWFAEMRNLEYLELTSSRLIDGSSYADWHIVYHAIRQHSRGIRVIFDQIIANDAAEISLNYDTVEDLQRVLDEKESLDPWDDITRSLSLYLSGKIEWNESLRMWHE